VASRLEIHLGEGVFLLGGAHYQPLFQATLVGLCLWTLCWWMYRQKIFIRI